MGARGVNGKEKVESDKAMGATTANAANGIIPMPDIPSYVYIISGLMVASLAGTQLLGMWLTGFRKPVPVRGRSNLALRLPRGRGVEGSGGAQACAES